MKKIFILAPVAVAGKHYQPDPFNSVQVEDRDALFLQRRGKGKLDTNKTTPPKKGDK